jgi:hypothetical protein
VNLSLLIEAVIVVESGGDPNAVGDNGHSVGILQIQAPVIEDVNRRFKKNYRWPQDAQNAATAREICRLYLSYWAAHFEYAQNRKVTFQDLARIWNGGPAGWRRPQTVAYWQRVQTALANLAPETDVT